MSKQISFDEIEEKVKDFKKLLESIDASSDKKKTLWKEIYENAYLDRMNAYMLFTDVYMNLSGDKSDHISLGQTMAKYLERMNKANDQLIKLVEIIAREEEKSSKINPDDIFSEIAK
tara:strand:+ start:1468 stop:1818 length:351 start_codon:yes stop_codon:yes gene_type:complete